MCEITIIDGPFRTPFGPLSARNHGDGGGDSPLFNDVNATQQMEKLSGYRSSIVIGRKGAGKTSLVKLLKEGYQFQLELKISDVFDLIKDDIARFKEGVNINHSAKKWKNLFWNTVLDYCVREPQIRSLFSDSRIKYLESYLSSIETFYSDKSANGGSFSKESRSVNLGKPVAAGLAVAEGLFEKRYSLRNAKRHVREVLEGNGIRILVIIDTLEEYSMISSKPAETCLAGLVYCARNICVGNSAIDCVLFLADEMSKLYRREITTSEAKDFENSHFILWNANELAHLCVKKVFHRVISRVDNQIFFDLFGGVQSKSSAAHALREKLPSTVKEALSDKL